MYTLQPRTHPKDKPPRRCSPTPHNMAAADADLVDVGLHVVKSAKGWEVKSFTRRGTSTPNVTTVSCCI